MVFSDWISVLLPFFSLTLVLRVMVYFVGFETDCSQPACPVPFSHRLIWEVWMPFVRNIVSQWQPRNCDPMVDFLDSWVHIIPVWILDNILDQLIFPKLQKEVGPGGKWL